MATTAFTAFLPEILPHLPACADIVAVNAVRNACIDFCTGSLVWNETQDAEAVTAASFPYDLSAPADARVCAVMSLRMNGKPLHPVFLDALEGVYQWDTHTSSSPDYYCQTSPDQLIVYPRLDASVDMVLRCAYAPTRTATGVETYVYAEYLEEIAAGALGKLMKLPGQPWSNPELGAYHSSMFEQAISDAAIRVNKSFSRAPTAIVMRPLA